MIVVRTEVWNTHQGTVAKAVTRDQLGRLIGATNQTANVPTIEKAVIVGRK